MTSAAVEIRNVVRRFGGFLALDRVSLSIASGSFAVLLGPSGSGKTTLLSILGGFLLPDEGQVLIGGREVTAVAPARRPTTTVFQDYALFPHMTVGANVAFGLRMAGWDRQRRTRRAEAMLALVGLPEAFGKKPHQLSGGQKQRIALARALAVEPAVLLLDEPLGALDLKLRRQMQEELKRIQREVGTTFVHVTHDQEEALAIADHIVVMNRGRIEDQGPPERVYLRPRTRFAADFMGQSCFLEGTVEALGADSLRIATAAGPLELPHEGEERFVPGEPVVISIRFEHFLTEPRGEALPLGRARVETATFLGTAHQVRTQHLAAPAFRPTLLLPQDRKVAPGEELALWVPRGAPIVLRVGD